MLRACTLALLFTASTAMADSPSDHSHWSCIASEVCRGDDRCHLLPGGLLGFRKHRVGDSLDQFVVEGFENSSRTARLFETLESAERTLIEGRMPRETVYVLVPLDLFCKHCLSYAMYSLVHEIEFSGSETRPRRMLSEHSLAVHCHIEREGGDEPDLSDLRNLLPEGDDAPSSSPAPHSLAPD